MLVFYFELQITTNLEDTNTLAQTYFHCTYIRVCHIFLDFKVSRYIEDYSFESIWGPFKVLKYLKV